jgi:hypothetical protein
MKKSLFTAFAVGLCMTASVMAQVPNYVPTNGLVGWWPFNGNANDESGNGNNGTVNGATLTADRFGVANKAYSFDGVNDWIEVLDNPSIKPLNTITISGWAVLDSSEQSNFPRLINKSHNQSQNYASYQIIGGNKGVDSLGRSGFTVRTTSSYNWTGHGGNTDLLNVWFHFTATYNGQTMNYYINGQLVKTRNQTGSILYNNENLYFAKGKDGLGNIDFTKCKLDEIGFWNRELNSNEIYFLYNLSNCAGNLIITPSTNLQALGSNSIFNATTSDANASFTWQSDLGQGFQTLNDFGNYSGTNTNVLSISNVQLANHNQPIRAISSNTNCTDTSNIATIQISDTCITTIYDTLLTTVTDTLIINTTLSLPAPNNENTILIYPNPASDHITIDNGNYTAMAGYTIRIENNAGQQVFQSAINQQQFYVDLSTWSGNGLYFVHLIDPQNNTVTVRKIVLQ